MKNIIFYGLVVLSIILNSCATTNSVVTNLESPELKKEIIRTIAVMDLLSDELSVEEKIKAEYKFIEAASLKYSNLRFLNSQTVLNSSNIDKIKNTWGPFWEKYINTKVIDEVALFDIAEIIKANAVLQIDVIDSEKIYGEHRKTIGQTTAKLMLSLFSLKSGKLLWEATVEGTQANAHSDQPVPKLIEAVNVAIQEISTKLPFE